MDFTPYAQHENLSEFFLTQQTLSRRLTALQGHATAGPADIEVVQLGTSRAGRPIVALRVGLRGHQAPARASIIAGAHADEPVGPMVAMALAEWLATPGQARPLLEHYAFFICPQVNPDGAEANRGWFADPIDPVTYARDFVREAPGDDVEFGFPSPSASPDPSVRPENQAVARFLAQNAPFAFHASLHSMSVAEGAYFLIHADWVERTRPLRRKLAQIAAGHQLGLHDIDRQGEKGFFRIEPGFCTTPTSTGMRDYFLAHNDPASAARFRMSSMEFVRSLGGDPLAIVTEMPFFTVQPGAIPGDAYQRFRQALPAARSAAQNGDPAPLRALFSQFGLQPVPLRTQLQLMAATVLESLDLVRNYPSG